LERERANELERALFKAGEEFVSLTATAGELARLVIEAQSEVERLRCDPAMAARADPAYAEVGLHQSAPDFLVKAARRAFRREYHPDTKSPREKPAAEATFKRHEGAFDRLFAMRGMSA